LRSAEVQVRDAISGVFERQTMAQLTQDGARDSLRVELAAAVAPFIKGASVKIYLPQFVIQ
jgi:flagellar basal body-associated protein FliL